MARTGPIDTEQTHRRALQHRRTERLAPLRGSAGAPRAKAAPNRRRSAFRQGAPGAL